jgi:hypothetical protein
MQISLLDRGGKPSASGRNDDAAETRKAKIRIGCIIKSTMDVAASQTKAWA